jgi:uncharacterized membrane protein
VAAPLNFLGIWILLQSPQVGVAPDFQQYADALDRLVAGEVLYGPDWQWRYSPVALLTLGPAIAAGLGVWTVLHLVAVLAIRPWGLAVLFGLSWPFWVDVVSGNTVTFVAVAGIAAMAGSRIGAYSYWWLTLIIPRPVQIPLLVFLAWRRPELRPGFLLLTVLNLVLLLLLGQGLEWIAYLLERGAEDTGAVFNVHPAADLAGWWLLIGVPAAVLLTVAGWPGQAGVILSPSLLAQYLLMAFVPPERPSAGRLCRQWPRGRADSYSSKSADSVTTGND